MKDANIPETYQESQNFFSVLQNCLAAGIVVVDGKSRIVTFTEEAEHITGLTSAKALHRLSKALPPPLRKIVCKVATSGRPASGAELILSSRARGKITVHASATPLSAGKTKKNPGVILVLHDVTPAKRLEENLRQLERLASIGTLSASTAHEIKNALVAVKTFMDLLLEKHSDGELAEIVRHEMRRIDSIVSQLLRFAAPPRSAFSPVRIHEILEHSLHTVQSQLIGKQISLYRKFNAATDSVKGDDYQLQQAFVNLLLNAIEAMGPAGKLTVATEIIPLATHTGAVSRPHVRVTVTDNGAGISSENLNRLFEPFFTTKKHGTGLGLSITQRIIQGHHGLINIESEPGKGAVFHVSFPVLSKS